MTTEPGFSSRSQTQQFHQLPERDGVPMDRVEHATDFALQPEVGFSNSDPAGHAPDDVHPDVPEPESTDPGFTNAKAVGGAKVINETNVEDKSVAKKPAHKK